MCKRYISSCSFIIISIVKSKDVDWYKLERELDKQVIEALVHSNKLDHVLQIHGGTLDAPDAFVEVEAYALEDNHELVFNLLSKCNPK